MRPRSVFDLHKWRAAGRAEFDFAWRGIASTPGGRTAMRVVIGSLAVMFGPFGLPMLWHPAGPAGAARAALFVSVLALGVALGVWWMVKPVHRFFDAVVFVVTADVLVASGAGLLVTSQARIATLVHLGLIATFVAFLLGWRMLVLQSVFALTVLSVHVATALAAGEPLVDLYVQSLPVVGVTVLLPAIVQVPVEFGRRATGKVYTERNRDPLTGAYNRSGMQTAIEALLRRRDSCVCLVAMVDLDSFKAYNDRYGHHAGDQVLVELARTVRAAADDLLVARIGGDEFQVLALRETGAAVEQVVARIAAVLQAGVGPTALTASLGTAVVRARDRAGVEAATVQADAALYAAKRNPDMRRGEAVASACTVQS